MADEPSTSFLRRKVAGIPVMYLLGAVAIVLVVIAIRMKPSASTDDGATSEDVPMETIQNDSVDGSYDGFVAKGSIVAAPPEKPEDNTPEETNASWLKKAVEWRVQNGASGGTVQAALQAYLAGSALSAEQGAERDKAIQQFGLPPYPPDSTATKDAPLVPARAQGPLPRSHTVTNANDDTFAEIAKLYYPTSDRTSVDLLRRNNYNRLVGDGPFRPGTTVWVPKYTTPKYYTSTKRYDTEAEIAKKNGISRPQLRALNPGLKFPVKSGTRVRVG